MIGGLEARLRRQRLRDPDGIATRTQALGSEFRVSGQTDACLRGQAGRVAGYDQSSGCRLHLRLGRVGWLAVATAEDAALPRPSHPRTEATKMRDTAPRRGPSYASPARRAWGTVKTNCLRPTLGTTWSSRFNVVAAIRLPMQHGQNDREPQLNATSRRSGQSLHATRAKPRCKSPAWRVCRWQEPRLPGPRPRKPVHRPSRLLLVRSCFPCFFIGSGGEKLLAEDMPRWCILPA